MSSPLSGDDSSTIATQAGCGAPPLHLPPPARPPVRRADPTSGWPYGVPHPRTDPHAHGHGRFRGRRAGARYSDMRDLGSIEILLGSNEL
ncbi:MAG: hypothetical protein P8Y93_02935 [Acidobacteriota bacterium]